jgi:hypothetical protein
MQFCDWHQTGECDRFGKPYHRCARCNRRWAFHRLASPIACKNGNGGLGDIVAASIKFATFGMVTPCGGCKERQAKLNELGRKLL